MLVQRFCSGEYDYSISDETWSLIFRIVAKNHANFNFAKDKIHTLWTVNGGHLRRKIKDDELISKVLSVTLPRYHGDGLILYRGECRFLFEDGKIGFCWTPKLDVATKFARGLNSLEPGGGLLLKAYAPESAIFSSPNSHSINQMGEYEYTCNPKLLENIEVLDCFPCSM